MTDEPGDLYAPQRDVYDLIHAEVKDHDREVQRLLKRVRGAIGRDPQSWLDVACGTGQHLAALHAAGVGQLAGVDLSPAQIEVAQARLDGIADVAIADMRDMQIPTPADGFDVVSCLLSSVGHLHGDEDYLAALRRMAAHLDPRGVLILEPWIAAEDFRPGRVDVDVAESEQIKVVRITKHALAHADGVAFSDLEFRFVVSRPDEDEAADWVVPMRLRLRSVHEQHAMLAQVFGRVEFQSTGAGSRGVFLARRPVDST